MLQEFFEANVYGVSIPNHDGRAGMACMVIDKEKFSLPALFNHLKKELPPYAAPLFIRLQTEIETTSTFKYKKVDLVSDGFNPEKVTDPVYFRDDSQGLFVPVDTTLYQYLISSAKL